MSISAAISSGKGSLPSSCKSLLLALVYFIYPHKVWVPEQKGHELNRVFYQGEPFVDHYYFMGIQYNVTIHGDFLEEAIVLVRLESACYRTSIPGIPSGPCDVFFSDWRYYPYSYNCSFKFQEYRFDGVIIKLYNTYSVVSVKNMSWYVSGHWEEPPIYPH